MIANRLVWLIAESAEDVKQGYASLIFTGCFFLVLIVVGIWWLKRSS